MGQPTRKRGILSRWISSGYPFQGGLPHSEIPGSTIARISPGLFAACHVLHRLSVPRHPPDALTSRLSATPNGKDHCQMPGIRHQRSRTSRCDKLLLLRRHFMQDTTHSPSRSQPAGRARSPATVTQLASLRLSISKCPAPPHQGMQQRHVSGSSCRVRLAPARLSRPGRESPLRVCCRKPLPARSAGALHAVTALTRWWR